MIDYKQYAQQTPGPEGPAPTSAPANIPVPQAPAAGSQGPTFDPLHPGASMAAMNPDDPMAQLGKLWEDWNPVTLVGKVAEFGVRSVIGTAAEGLGSVPLDMGDPNESKIDVMQYERTPEAAMRLVSDLTNEFQTLDHAKQNNAHVNLAAVFMQLGKWQQVNDPDGFAEWKKTLEKAQADKGWAQTGIGSHAGEILNDYIRQTGAMYADMTSKGMEGHFAEAPELAFGTSGSWGQKISDTFDHLMLYQHKAEKGAAFISGNRAGLGGVVGGLMGEGRPSAGRPELGARLDELLASDPKDLGPIELAALGGYQSGWTVDHVYNFLVSHGQGYSSDPGTQIATSIALDPIGVAQLGLSGGSMAVRNAVQGARGAERFALTGRLGGVYDGITRSIGTTVAEASRGPVGGAFKVARTIIDPFSGIPSKPAAIAKTDTTAAAGMMGFYRGIGAGGYNNAMRRAQQWGVTAEFDRLAGITGMNNLRQWAQHEIVQELVGSGIATARRVLPEEQLQFLMKNAPKDAATRIAAHTMRNRQFYLTATEKTALAERMAKTLGIHIDDATEAVGEMVAEEQALWHWLSYTHADQDWMRVKSTIRPEEWTEGMGGKVDDLTILNPNELDRVAGFNIVKDLREGVVTKTKANAANATLPEPAKFKLTTPKSAPGKPARPPVASLPDEFVEEPGYAYRVETPEAMGMGMPPRTGVTVGKPTAFYEGKDGVAKAIFRIADDGTLDVGRHGAGGADRLTTRAVASSEIEMLGADGKWHRLASTPAAKRVKLKGAEAVAHWNRLADRFTLIGALGKVRTHSQLLRKVDALEAAIKRGALHSALGADEVSSLPKQARDFLARHTSTDGKPMWRIGFKPSDELATGLVHNGEGLVPRFGAHVDHVSDMLKPIRRGGPITDAAGRLIPRAVRESAAGQAVARTRDGLEVALQTLRDVVDSERIVMSVEQGFRRRMRDLGYSDTTARSVFKMSREYAAEPGHGFSLAGLNPDGWWRATEAELAGIIGEKVAKREVFGALLEAAGGDMRLIGLTSHGTQRIRAGLAARKDSGNWLGTVTVGMYGTLRYTLNPIFYLQTITDAPWFNMLRGVPVDVLGKPIRPGSDLDKMLKISTQIGKTGTYRDLAMDFTDRAYTVYAQARILDNLKTAGIEPALKRNIWERTRAAFSRKAITQGADTAGAETGFRPRMTRMMIRNQLLFEKHDIGVMVLDGVKQTDKFVAEQIAAATSDAERLAWQNAYQDIMKPLDDIAERLKTQLGRNPTDNEIGLEYLSDIVHDATLGEEYTRAGYLDYRAINAKGAYIMPSDYGRLGALDVEYGVAALGLPNINNLADLQKALTPVLGETAEQAARRGRITIGDVREIMLGEGFHKDHVQRFIDRVTFDYEDTIARWADVLGMTRQEMAGIEDIIAAEAKRMGMKSADYLTQVLPLTAKASKGMDGAIAKIIQAFRKAELGVDDATGLVADRLHPSMKRVLLDEFGLTEWGATAERRLTALAREAAQGNLPASHEVRNALGAYAKIMKDTPALKLGDELRDLVDSLPADGGSAFNQTETVLLGTIMQNFRLAEKDAIRLANLQSERSVLERSLNHPFFGLYPSSYMWGKVVPETLRFFAKEPFGIKTGNMAWTYAKIQQDIAIQQEYDPRMASLWDDLGKSAVLGLISYSTPSMPWEDMAAHFPPWLEQIAEDKGIDLRALLEREFYTISPLRWFRDTLEAAEEIGDAFESKEPAAVPPLLPTIQEEGGPPAPSGPADAAPPASSDLSQPVQGAALGPVLGQGLADLETALFHG